MYARRDTKDDKDDVVCKQREKHVRRKKGATGGVCSRRLGQSGTGTILDNHDVSFPGRVAFYRRVVQEEPFAYT